MTGAWCPVWGARIPPERLPSVPHMARYCFPHGLRAGHHRQLLVQRASPRRLRRVDVLAVAGLSFVFGSLLDPENGGAFAIEGIDGDRHAELLREHERPADARPAAPRLVRALDFAPRFLLYDRYYKPPMLVRIIRPLSGEPRAVVRCRPYEYGAPEPTSWAASNHVEYRASPLPCG